MTQFRGMRLRNLMTQKDSAALIGVEQSQLSRWEKGDTVPKPETLAKIAETYKVDVSEVEAAVQEVVDMKEKRRKAEIERRMMYKLQAERGMKNGTSIPKQAHDAQ